MADKKIYLVVDSHYTGDPSKALVAGFYDEGLANSICEGFDDPTFSVVSETLKSNLSDAPDLPTIQVSDELISSHYPIP